MTNFPDKEQVEEFRTAQTIENAQKEIMEDEDSQVSQREDLEDDMQLKAALLDPQAKNLFPDLNKPDLLISYINSKDKKTIEQITYDLRLAVDLQMVGFYKPAKLLATRILTQLNLNRSVDGFQQQALITRVKAQRLDMQEKNTSGFDKFSKKSRR